MPILGEGDALTVGDLVDRVYREGVRLASEQPLVVLANDAATSAATSIDLDLGTLAVEEQDNLSPGILLEHNLELMFIESVRINSGVATVTVQRGFMSTTAEAIVAGDQVVIAPDAPRVNVFNAVCDEIVNLYPQIWALETVSLSSSDSFAEVDSNTVSVQSYRYQSLAADPNPQWYSGRVQLLRNFPASDTGKAVQFLDAPSGRNGYLTIRKKFSRPADLDDSLVTLGVEDEWQQIVVFGAIATVLYQMDPQRVSVEWSTDSNEAGVAPPGASTSLASRFRSRANQLRNEGARRLRTESPTTIVVNNPLRPWAGAS